MLMTEVNVLEAKAFTCVSWALKPSQYVKEIAQLTLSKYGILGTKK